MKRSIPIQLKTRSKYRAVRTTVDGITFDSKKESERYRHLKQLEGFGLIQDLELQPKFYFYVKGKMLFRYIADFQYRENKGMLGGTKLVTVVEDSKGFRTPVYRLKKKIIEAIYEIQIQEV